MGRPKNTYLQDMNKIYELWSQLNDVIGVDDNKQPEDYTVEEIVYEANFLLIMYLEGGTIQGYALDGYDGKEAQKDAKKTVRQLQAYIKKWSR
jgi:hypothetical protein